MLTRKDVQNVRQQYSLIMAVNGCNVVSVSMGSAGIALVMSQFTLAEWVTMQLHALTKLKPEKRVVNSSCKKNNSQQKN